jgi:uncharacterized protein YjbJ (UPF0337 family)
MNKDQFRGRIKEAKGKPKKVAGKVASNKDLFKVPAARSKRSMVI